MRSPLIAKFLDPQQHETRSRVLWLLLGVVVVAQLFAFWVLCSEQVQKAEDRRAQSQVSRTALADCLQTVPGATLATCTGRTDSMPVRAPQAMTATPVSFTFR